MGIRVRYVRQDERAAAALAEMLDTEGVVLDPCGECPPGDALVVVWSAAAGAAWAGGEPYGAADGRVVPVLIDDTPLPPPLDGLPRVRLALSVHRLTEAAGAMVVHLADGSVPRPAVRGESSELRLLISDFGPLGLFAGCPRCGEGSERLRAYVTVDHATDRALRLVICGACRWQDGCDL